MKLLVTTPVSVTVDADDVGYVRAEDETGAFGILPGHADFVTVLAVSVVTWRAASDGEHHVAVRGGVLTVSGGDRVEIATREAVGEDTLRRLDRAVLKRFREEASAEEESRMSATRLHLAAIWQLQRYLQSGRQVVPQGLVRGAGDAMPSAGLAGRGGDAAAMGESVDDRRPGVADRDPDPRRRACGALARRPLPDRYFLHRQLDIPRHRDRLLSCLASGQGGRFGMTAAGIALYLLAGGALGGAYFALLFRAVGLHAARAPAGRVVPLHLARLAAVGAVFWAVAQHGALPLLLALAGFVAARLLVQRRVASG